MVPRLRDLLIRQCELIKYMGMALSDVDDCDISELKFMIEWLKEEFRKNARAVERRK